MNCFQMTCIYPSEKYTAEGTGYYFFKGAQIISWNTLGGTVCNFVAYLLGKCVPRETQ